MNNAKQERKSARNSSTSGYRAVGSETILDIKRGFSTADAAIYLGVSQSHLRHSRLQPPSANGPRYTRIGRKILYLREDLDAWLNKEPVA